jgi:hypothetical protein
LTCQMSSAYSRMVRSLENLPLPAVYMMDLRRHGEGDEAENRQGPCLKRHQRDDGAPRRPSSHRRSHSDWSLYTASTSSCAAR